MPASNMTPELLRGLLLHLDNEVQVLHRLREFSEGLTRTGFTPHAASQRQAELGQLKQDLAQVQQHRHQLRVLLSRAWRCAPQDVHLSQVCLETSEMTAAFHQRRCELFDLAVETSASVGATYAAVSCWHAIVHSLLSGVLSGTCEPDRYSASGQRVPSGPVIGIDVRS